jgi:hypothetical protein
LHTISALLVKENFVLMTAGNNFASDTSIDCLAGGWPRAQTGRQSSQFEAGCRRAWRRPWIGC